MWPSLATDVPLGLNRVCLIQFGVSPPYVATADGKIAFRIAWSVPRNERVFDNHLEAAAHISDFRQHALTCEMQPLHTLGQQRTLLQLFKKDLALVAVKA